MDIAKSQNIFFFIGNLRCCTLSQMEYPLSLCLSGSSTPAQMASTREDVLVEASRRLRDSGKKIDLEITTLFFVAKILICSHHPVNPG